MNKRGFTLPEMIVAIGIFTAVMFVSTGALLSIVSVNKKAQAQQSAINNLSFALENMARNIRTGSNYHCESSGEPGDSSQYQSGVSLQDCTSGGSLLIFDASIYDSNYVTTGDNIWAYYLKEVGGVGSGHYQIVKMARAGSNNREVYEVTAPEIVITGLKFYVDGTASGDSKQPKVRINVTGFAFVKENTGNPRRVDFSLQTTASQRKRDS
jgi:prepilin-type N-terminal cleavage/methylation domain-containing protein